MAGWNGRGKMSKHKEIYRGFEIEAHDQSGFVIRRNGEVFSSQPSIEFAYKIIDETKKKERAALG
jgi:AAA+ superfamily predicted ATPase